MVGVRTIPTIHIGFVSKAIDRPSLGGVYMFKVAREIDQQFRPVRICVESGHGSLGRSVDRRALQFLR
jgi:hypothetical protein